MYVMVKIEFSVKKETQVPPDRFWMKYGSTDQCEIDGRIKKITSLNEVKHFWFVVFHDEARIWKDFRYHIVTTEKECRRQFIALLLRN